MKAAALRGALSDRARHGRIHVLTAVVEAEVPSTKAALATLHRVSERRHVLVVLSREDSVGLRSVRNLEQVHWIYADQLNTYDVLVSDDVVFTRAALDAFLAGPPRGRSASAVGRAADGDALAGGELGTGELSGVGPSLEKGSEQ
jgi:large subunit ribosomal protein L4